MSVRGAGKNDILLIRDDRLSEWKPMFSIDCKTGKSPSAFLASRSRVLGGNYKGPPSLPITFKTKVLVLKGKCRGFRVFENRVTKFSRAGIELDGDNGLFWESQLELSSKMNSLTIGRYTYPLSTPTLGCLTAKHARVQG